jgi:UDP-N-acetyl-D-galactosamine dehydrogenase
MSNFRIGIIGLGYVGLPLAIEFAKQYKVVGFDANASRVAQLREFIDITQEVHSDELKAYDSNIAYCANIESLKGCDFYIVTVPTPVNIDNRPDLKPLIEASTLIGSVMSANSIVIYESTVYPGVTEEVCVPLLEAHSKLVFNLDFYVGYSPERINPGDKSRGVADIIKVTSGSTKEAAIKVDALYKSIITAGTFAATSIKVAEASKVVENIQRDVNIALVNELHQIFFRLGVNTLDVIEAASTKWNFMKLTPGLVGGHCIGIDPYYLLHKAQTTGYMADLMRSAREINNAMPQFVVSAFISTLIKRKINPIDLQVLVLGCTFKEDCPDTRNSKNLDLCSALFSAGFHIQVYDPLLDTKVFVQSENYFVYPELPADYDVVILAVKHTQIMNQLSNIVEKSRHNYLYDYRNMV